MCITVVYIIIVILIIRIIIFWRDSHHEAELILIFQQHGSSENVTKVYWALYYPYNPCMVKNNNMYLGHLW